MKLLLVDNAHIYKTKDGKYFTPSIYSYDFFKRYLNSFSSVRFAAKTKYLDNAQHKNLLRVDGPQVEIFEIPWYDGLNDLRKNIN